MFDDNLVVTYLLGKLRIETFYPVGVIKRHLAAKVYRAVIFPEHGPERVFNATDEIIEATVSILRLVVLYVAYALLQRRRDHILAHVVRVVPVPGIPQQMFGYEPEISADLRRRFPGFLAFLQLFRELL